MRAASLGLAVLADAAQAGVARRLVPIIAVTVGGAFIAHQGVGAACPRLLLRVEEALAEVVGLRIGVVALPVAAAGLQRSGIAGVGALLFAVTALAAWLPQYYERHMHMAEGTGEALFMGLIILGGIPGVLMGGRVADRYAPRIQGGRLALPAIFIFIGTVLFTIVISPPCGGSVIAPLKQPRKGSLSDGENVAWKKRLQFSRLRLTPMRAAPSRTRRIMACLGDPW